MEENQQILGLLECLQEYIQAAAELQSLMGDGYMEIANTRRKSTGLLIPDLILSAEPETRKLKSSLDLLEENKQKVRISGISEDCVEATRNEFEKALACVLRLVKIKQQWLEKYESVEKIVKV